MIWQTLSETRLYAPAVDCTITRVLCKGETDCVYEVSAIRYVEQLHVMGGGGNDPPILDKIARG